MSHPGDMTSYPRPPSCRPSAASAALAALLAGATFSILPFFGLLSARQRPAVELLPAPRVAAPLPPVAHRPVRTVTLHEASRPVQRPQLRKPTPEKPMRNVQPVEAQLSLPLPSLQANVADFALDFAVQAEAALPRKIGTAERTELVVPRQGPLLFQLYELDGPPHPLSMIEPIYPAAAKAKGIEGYVELEFIITPEGMVTDIKAMRSEPQGTFESSARQAAERWRFTPPTRHGRPVRVRVRQVVHFRME